jgi:hypothetical protein
MTKMPDVVRHPRTGCCVGCGWFICQCGLTMCGDCGAAMELVRPGKWQCNSCPAREAK